MRGAVYGAAVTVAKPAKVAEKVVDLARDSQKTEKKVERALDTKQTKTESTIRQIDPKNLISQQSKK